METAGEERSRLRLVQVQAGNKDKGEIATCQAWANPIPRLFLLQTQQTAFFSALRFSPTGLRVQQPKMEMSNMPDMGVPASPTSTCLKLGHHHEWVIHQSLPASTRGPSQGLAEVNLSKFLVFMSEPTGSKSRACMMLLLCLQFRQSQ